MLGVALTLGAVGCGGGDGAASPGSTIDDSTIDDSIIGASDALAVDGGDGAPRCNGDARLCGRRLDEITLAGAHNAMSSKAEGWAFANQDVPFDALLDTGIRALLMDVHSWADPDVGGPATLWFCHGNCLLGKMAFDVGLQRLRTWLDAHPREVVMVVLEVAAPNAEIVAAIEKAGLVDRAFRWTGGPLPTLGALLDAGVQLVWSAESGGGSPDWYHDVWSMVRDTPYTFHSMAEIQAEDGADDACRPNRGKPEAPLLQVNHWVAKVLPDVSLSEQANTLPVLLQRAAHCAALRGSRVHLLVVDHATRGEVVRAARILNELEAAP